MHTLYKIQDLEGVLSKCQPTFALWDSIGGQVLENCDNGKQRNILPMPCFTANMKPAVDVFVGYAQ